MAVAFVIQAASSELNMFNFLFSTPSPALLQDVCLLAAHITEPYKRQLKRMCNTNSAWGEREERERKEKLEGRGVRETERKKERKYVRKNVQHHLSLKTRTDTVSIDLYYNSSKL